MLVILTGEKRKTLMMLEWQNLISMSLDHIIVLDQSSRHGKQQQIQFLIDVSLSLVSKFFYYHIKYINAFSKALLKLCFIPLEFVLQYKVGSIIYTIIYLFILPSIVYNDNVIN